MPVSAEVKSLTKTNAGHYKVEIDLHFDSEIITISRNASTNDPFDAIEEVRAWLYDKAGELAKAFQYQNSLK